MKKLIPILFVVAVLAACQKEPSLSKLDDDYVVFTDYDKSADFGEYLTYYMPDSVLLITNNEKRPIGQMKMPIIFSKHLPIIWLLGDSHWSIRKKMPI